MLDTGSVSHNRSKWYVRGTCESIVAVTRAVFNATFSIETVTLRGAARAKPAIGACRFTTIHTHTHTHTHRTRRTRTLCQGKNIAVMQLHLGQCRCDAVTMVKTRPMTSVCHGYHPISDPTAGHDAVYGSA